MKINFDKKFNYTLSTNLDIEEIKKRIFSGVRYDGKIHKKAFHGQFEDNNFIIEPAFLNAPRFLLWVIINGVIERGEPNIIKINGQLNKSTISILKIAFFFNIFVIGISPLFISLILKSEGLLEQYFYLMFLIPFLAFVIIYFSIFHITFFFAKFKIEESIKLINKLIK